ncbi:MAG: YbaB/EbfC family nucleoid-associated protein [Lachnospiraceae bacterium]|nr:YbaB/EbfC family nucleoid-associated protein [Lachnospiraceae bacterium]
MAKHGGFPGGAMPGNMANLMKQAQRMQRQMEEGREKLESTEFTGSAGGGAVEVRINGKRDVLAITLDKDIVDPDDVETLQDSILAAIKDAMDKADAAGEEIMGGLNGMPAGLF